MEPEPLGRWLEQIPEAGDAFAEFTRGVERALGRRDFLAHYDLAMA